MTRKHLHLLIIFLTLFAFYYRQKQEPRYTVFIEVSELKNEEKTPQDTTPNDVSQQWLSLFNLRDICPEIFEKDPFVEENSPWKHLQLDVPLPKISSFKKKSLQEPYWDGRDFRFADGPRSI